MRFLVLAALPILAIAPLASADGPVATGGDSGRAPPSSSTPAPPLLDQAGASDDGSAEVPIGPCGPTKIRPDGKPDTSARGEVEVGVGSQGYRHVAATICKPLGNAAIIISASDTEYDGRPGRR